MKKLLLLIPLTFLICSSLYSQVCGTPSPTENLNYTQYLDVSSRNGNEACLDVKFHILRNSNGENAIDETQIPNIIGDLNAGFNRFNIFFNTKSIDFITSDLLYNIDDNLTIFDEDCDAEFNLLTDTHNDSSVFHIYIVNLFECAGGRAADIPSNEFVIPASVVSNNRRGTVIHEMGHCLGLKHTHETSNGTENIQRSGNPLFVNCSSAGDGLCSTPADPNLYDDSGQFPNFKVDFNCNYTYNETRLGLPYDPDTHNCHIQGNPVENHLRRNKVML